MNQKNACPKPEELAGYVDGTLAEISADSIADHIESCHSCEAAVANLEGMSDPLLSKLREPQVMNAGDKAFWHQLLPAIEAIGRGGPGSAIRGRAPVDNGMGNLGQYQLLEKLGEGGMGVVYKAMHRRLRRVVALKVLPAEHLQKTNAVARFEREMQAVGQLNHPNIVAAHDAGEADGKHYLVMELLQGVDLAKLLRRHGPLPIPEACELVRQAALGLGYAHKHGMVHRDIKPSNLMLCETEEGRPIVKVLDMGVALLVGQHHEKGELTDSNRTMGTVEYMAPEQGLNSHGVDIRADVYSLGATLYKLLAGETPFPSSTYDSPLKVMVARTTMDAPSIGAKRDLPADLVNLVDRMLARNPDRRPATPQEVADALANHVRGCDLKRLLRDSIETNASHRTDTATVSRTVNAELAPTITQAAPPRRRRGVFLGAAAALAASLLALAAVVFYLPTPNGTILVDIPDDEITVVLTKTGAVFKKADSMHDIVLTPGDYGFNIKRGEFSFHTDKLILKKGQTVRLRIEYMPGKLLVAKADGNVIGRADAPKPTLTLPVMPKLPAKTLHTLHTPKPVIRWPLTPTKSEDLQHFSDLKAHMVVRVRPAGMNQTIHTGATLPSVPATIVAIDFWDADPDRVDDEAMRRLATLIDLEDLRLHFNRNKSGKITNAGRQHLGALANLRELHLTNTVPDRLDASFVAKLQRMESLHVAGRGPIDWIGPALQVPTLREIHTFNVPLSDDELLSLTQLPRLTRLHLRGPGTSLDGVKKFAAKLPWCRIEAVDLKGAPGRTVIEPTQPCP